ncbi:MAG: NYN domain-containing protein [Candidatus Pacebacteria bacterium]|nr:NYN domain-containing protein [Candidatus Paceibacterota bacterium]
MKEENNLAFIDEQNLYRGTMETDPKWRVDLFKFRKYLSEKYDVKRAYYFLGFLDEENQSLYDRIQESGFVIKFRRYNSAMKSKKKGNVDSDIIFDVMKRLYRQEDFDKVLLVSGDGDYMMLVDFLIEEGKFKKILFPNKDFASSLYKKMGSEYFDFLSNGDIKKKIEKQKKAP